MMLKKIDQQDDAAATRTFSAQMLKYATEMQPENLGLWAYLFVVGELINACQNHAISFGKCIVMAFRALFFFQIWKKFLQESSYDE